jgi:ribosomal protein S7
MEVSVVTNVTLPESIKKSQRIVFLATSWILTKQQIQITGLQVFQLLVPNVIPQNQVGALRISGSTMQHIFLFIQEHTKESGKVVPIVIQLKRIRNLAVSVVTNTINRKATMSIRESLHTSSKVHPVIPVILWEQKVARLITIQQNSL